MDCGGSLARWNATWTEHYGIGLCRVLFLFLVLNTYITCLTLLTYILLYDELIKTQLIHHRAGIMYKAIVLTKGLYKAGYLF